MKDLNTDKLTTLEALNTKLLTEKRKEKRSAEA